VVKAFKFRLNLVGIYGRLETLGVRMVVGLRRALRGWLGGILEVIEGLNYWGNGKTRFLLPREGVWEEPIIIL